MGYTGIGFIRHNNLNKLVQDPNKWIVFIMRDLELSELMISIIGLRNGKLEIQEHMDTELDNIQERIEQELLVRQTATNEMPLIPKDVISVTETAELIRMNNRLNGRNNNQDVILPAEMPNIAYYKEAYHTALKFAEKETIQPLIEMSPPLNKS